MENEDETDYLEYQSRPKLQDEEVSQISTLSYVDNANICKSRPVTVNDSIVQQMDDQLANNSHLKDSDDLVNE